MTASWNLCTSGEAIIKMGANANATIIADTANLALWSVQAEGDICSETRYDWVSNLASVGTYFKGILNNISSAMVAMKGVAYGYSSYPTRLEAQTILDVLRDEITRNMAALKQDNQKTKMGATNT